MRPKVSVVIPCFNAEKWISQAIDSVLQQTWANVEVVVVDDGSADNSVDLIRSYAPKVRFETQRHLGGNAARNHGLEISSGCYVQFLDADDYLLPQKLARQVHFLQSSGADIVYGDWRHQYHCNGDVRMGNVIVSGQQPDVLQSLLKGWWVAPCALLCRRQLVKQIGGWDEDFAAAQDRDFMLTAALAGARIQYQPGCESIYRRYGNVTISTSNRMRWLENNSAVLAKAWQALEKRGRLTVTYRRAMAESYFLIARNYFDLDRTKYFSAMDKVLTLDPTFRPRESLLYNVIQRICGFAAAEACASVKRRYLRKGRTLGPWHRDA